MFGYVIPEKPELKIREYEIFRAYYCSVCKAISKRYGQLPRLALNYDATFLALLLSSLQNEADSVAGHRCPVHPLKKRRVVAANEAINYAADINVILAYYNFEDNWRDEKSPLSAAGKMALRAAFKKACARLPEKSRMIGERLAELSALEKRNCASLDEAAEPFAALVGEIAAFSPLCGGDDRERVLRWIGYNLGKWIYILDAFNDLEEDIRDGNYNPIVSQHRLAQESPSELRERIAERIRFAVTCSLNEIAKAFELLDIKKNRGLLENIIYLGMLRKSERILSTRSCEKIEKSV